MSLADRLAGLIEARIGIDLRRSGATLALERFVTARASTLGFDDPADYLGMVEDQSIGAPEHSRLISVATNGLTFFDRDPRQFAAIMNVLEEAGRGGRTVHVWSAGCSTGEEPYTLAMQLQERGLAADILGTDIDEEALAVAKAGRYRPWSMRRLGPDVRERFFEPDGERYAVSPAIRSTVRFQRHNLVDPVPPRAPAGGWDMILCQNVFIYEHRELVRVVVRRMRDALRPGGWLVTGVTESLVGMDVGLQPRSVAGRVFYQAVEPAELPPVPVPTVASQPPRRDPFAAAVTLLAERRRPEARVLLEELLATRRNHVAGWLTLGNVRLHAHALDLALEAYVEAQRAAALLAEPHFLQGVVYRKQGEIERAEAALRRALFLDPEYWPASYLLAGVYERLGRASRALTELERTLELTRDLPEGMTFEVLAAGVDSIELDAVEIRALCCRRLARF